MKRSQISIILVLVILISHLSIFRLSAMAASVPKTPSQALSEMSWGVNLGNLYMADKVYNETGSNTGYCYYAPIGLAAWFWDGSFDWLAYYSLYEESFSASLALPAYQASIEDPWFDGIFKLGVFIKNYTADSLTFELYNTRIVKADGSVEFLHGADGIHTVSDFSDFNDAGFAFSFLEVDGIPEPSADYTGAVLKTDIQLIEVPFSEFGKVNYFFEYQRQPIDQYSYTNAYLDQGANVFRLPVTWSSFVDDETFVIDSDWIDAIKTEVDYILSRGAYCILNMHDDYLSTSFVGDHWEECWMLDEYKEYVDVRYESIWEQIADNFRDYPDTLIFESANEPTMNWDPTRLSMSEFAELQIRRTNELNDIFFNAVRRSGGNNETRILCFAVANYNSVQQLDYLTLPEDDYIIATLHSYQEMEDNTPGSSYDPNFDYMGRTDAFFDAVDRFTSSTGVPVLIGEVGTTHRIEDTIRADRISYYYQKCVEAGTPALWWEDYFLTDDGYYYWMYDIENQTWPEQESLSAIQEIYGIVPGPALDSPQFEIVHGILFPNEMLEIELFYLDSDTDELDIYVVASDNRSCFREYSIESNHIFIRTDDMLPGVYKLMLSARANGRTSGYASKSFTIVGTNTASVQLPSGLLSIESEAFANMYNAIVRIPGSVQSIADDAFDLSVTVICPADSYAAFRCSEIGLNVIVE